MSRLTGRSSTMTLRNGPEHIERTDMRGGELSAGQHDERNIRPGRLRIERLDQAPDGRGRQRLFADEHHAGRVFDSRAQVLDRRADFGRKARLAQHRAGQRGVAADRRKHEHAFFPVAHSGCAASDVPSPTNVGTPVKMP